MDRDEILERSRRENLGEDEYEREVSLRSAQLGMKVGLLACCVVAAGGLGNILDRVRLGYVVDMFNFQFIDYPVFNVADCYIVLSAIGLFILFMFVYKEEDLKWIGSASK